MQLSDRSPENRRKRPDKRPAPAHDPQSPGLAHMIGVLTALVVALTASTALAHPGGLAAEDCHYCQTNCVTNARRSKEPSIVMGKHPARSRPCGHQLDGNLEPGWNTQTNG